MIRPCVRYLAHGNFRTIRTDADRVQVATRMSTFQLFRSAARRATPSLGRRGYAEASGKLNLSLTLPHKVRLLLQNILRPLTRSSDYLPLPRCSAGKRPCRIGRHGYSCKSCSLDRTTASRCCGSPWIQWLPEVFRFVVACVMVRAVRLSTKYSFKRFCYRSSQQQANDQCGRGCTAGIFLGWGMKTVSKIRFLFNFFSTDC